jgi:hypothetical protein
MEVSRTVAWLPWFRGVTSGLNKLVVMVARELIVFNGGTVSHGEMTGKMTRGLGAGEASGGWFYRTKSVYVYCEGATLRRLSNNRK